MSTSTNDEHEDDERAPLISDDHDGETTSRYAAPAAVPSELPALHTVRLIGALHICVYHTAPGSPLGPGAAWGASWVPFYFLLSGFGPAHSRLLQNSTVNPLCPSISVLLRRLAAVYPMHVLGVLLSASVAIARGESIRLGTLTLELLLLHAWMPASWTLGYCADAACTRWVSLAYNMPTWFVSVLMGYWFLEPSAFRLGSVVCRQSWPMLSCAVLNAIWVLVWPWARCPLTWGTKWWNAVDVLTYVHLYASGAILAHMLHERAKHGVMRHRQSQRRPMRWMASAAAILLTCIFGLDLRMLFGPKCDPTLIDHWTHKVDVLLPLHAMLLLGLAEGDDPLSIALSMRPLPWLRHLALGVYLLQAPTYEALTLATSWPTPYSQACVP